MSWEDVSTMRYILFCVLSLSFHRNFAFVLDKQNPYSQFRKWNVGLNGTLELEFKTDQPNGLLLYTDDGGTYDFFELKLVNGALRLRYNLGGGAQIITVGNNLNDGHWHKVQVARRDEHTSLAVDGSTQTKTSRGKEFIFGKFTTNSDVFVGGIPPSYNSKLTTLALPSVIFEPKFRGSVRNLVYSDLPGQLPRRQELRHSRDLKDMFIEIMRVSAPIIENKQTDTNTNKKKNLEWVKIQKKLKELSGVHRDIPQLKGLWRRTKLAAKKTVSEHRRAVRGTGGGQQPPSPSQKDLTIMDLCPMDFVEEENKFDSDAVSTFISQDEGEVHNSTVIYDIDVNEDIENEPGTSFIDETITVKDVYNDEVQIKLTEKTNTDKIKKTKPQINTSKAAVVEANMEVKQRAIALMEEEYALKIKYQHEEIAHQQLKHKLEIEILMLEKEKKLMEIELIKKKL